MEEIWKQIDDGYEQYQISTFGRVKSLKRKSEKILSLDKDRNGYMNVKLCKNGTMKKLQSAIAGLSASKHRKNKQIKHKPLIW